MTKTQHVFRVLLGLFLLLAGTGHLTWSRIEFLAQVPNWIPISGSIVVAISGIIEVLLGLSLVLLLRFQILVGWTVALFFVLIFPGNISQYINGIDAFGLDTDTQRFVRLFFQPILIFWALWSTGAWKEWCKRKE